MGRSGGPKKIFKGIDHRCEGLAGILRSRDHRRLPFLLWIDLSYLAPFRNVGGSNASGVETGIRVSHNVGSVAA